MEPDLPIDDALTIPGVELSFEATRAGGPGGQHVNKTSTAVQLSWSIDGSAVLTERQRQRLLERLAPRLTRHGVLRVRVESERSQRRNRDEARDRLAALVRDALRELPRRRPTRVPLGARRRRLERKRRRAAIKRLRTSPGEED